MAWKLKGLAAQPSHPGCTTAELFDGMLAARGGAVVSADFPLARIDGCWRTARGALQAVFELSMFDDETHLTKLQAFTNEAVAWQNGTPWDEEIERQLFTACDEAVQMASAGPTSVRTI